MRNLALLLLLASAAAPVMAQSGERSSEDRAAARAERAQARAERAERTEARSNEARAARSEQRASRAEPPSAPVVTQTQSVEQQAVQQSAPAAQETRSSRRQAYESRRERIREQRTSEPVDAQTTASGDGIAPRQRDIRTIPDTSPTTVVTRNNDGTITTQHRSRDGRRWSENHRRWDRDHWRGDRRYDWRRYRSHHRSLFRLGLYIDPFGWGYRRWGIGSYLYPNYYSSSFWLNDPWQYRLPPVYGPYRWVRYHDDALLVDIYSGQVVDVIYNFFW
ncbi:RcnB family protein [Sphingomonas sp. HDW15A]|uniref:RcnB family protein n=1 Tax=Sphingomonas sp. HDW15A TaxID=2714942 RepID=UPI001F0F376E|nr:RcnB family protein [Sphingomonas sp. HDW15A]